jgi:nitrogen fixation protein FixH
MVITWLNSATQKHHRIIFGFLLVVVSVSFVFYTGAARSESGLRKHPSYLGVDLYNGRAIERFNDALMLGGNPSDNRERTLQICLNIARKNVADSLDIPTPTESEVQERVRAVLARGTPNAPAPDAKTWEAFVNSIQQTLGCNRAEALVRLQTVIEDQLRWEKTAQLLAGPGYASVDEVRKALEDDGAKWTVQVAQLDSKSFTPTVAEDLAKAEAYFNSTSENYRIPAHLTLRAVTFPVPKTKDRTISDEEVLTHAYNFATELGLEAGKVAEQAKARRSEIEQRIRVRSAIEESSAQLSDELAESFPGEKPAPAAVESWIKKHGGSIRDLPPFDAGSPTQSPGVPAAAISAAENLSDKNWHTDIYTTSAGPVLLLIQDRTPSRIPAFKEVKEKVVEAWKQSERGRLFIIRANELGKTLKTTTAQSKNFADSARSLGLILQTAPAAFTPAETPENLRGVNVPTYLALSDAGVGKVTDPLRVEGGNFIYLYVANREVPKIDVTTEDFKKMLSALARQNARTTLLGRASFNFNGENGSENSKGLLDELTSDPTGSVPITR